MIFRKLNEKGYNFRFNYAKKLIDQGLLNKVNIISEETGKDLKPGDVISYIAHPLMFIDSNTVVCDLTSPNHTVLFKKFIDEVNTEYKLKTEFIDTNSVEWEILEKVPDNFQGTLFIEPSYFRIWVKYFIAKKDLKSEGKTVKVTVKDQIGLILYEFIFNDQPCVYYDKSAEAVLDECLLRLEIKYIISWFYRNHQNTDNLEIE